MKKVIFTSSGIFFLVSCQNTEMNHIFEVGYVGAVEDGTMSRAKESFLML